MANDGSIYADGSTNTQFDLNGRTLTCGGTVSLNGESSVVSSYGTGTFDVRTGPLYISGTCSVIRDLCFTRTDGEFFASATVWMSENSTLKLMENCRFDYPNSGYLLHMGSNSTIEELSHCNGTLGQFLRAAPDEGKPASLNNIHDCTLTQTFEDLDKPTGWYPQFIDFDCYGDFKMVIGANNHFESILTNRYFLYSLNHGASITVEFTEDAVTSGSTFKSPAEQ